MAEVVAVQQRGTTTASLQQQLDAVQNLEQLLQQEQEALLRRDSVALARIATEKQTLIDTIEASADLVRGEMPTGTAESGVTSLREELAASLLRCQKQNQVNGMMLERDRQQTRQLLELLLGKKPGQGQTELYDARGGTHSSYSHGQPVKA